MSAGRTWWVLIGSCLGLFVLMLDSTEVVLALPVIDKDLGLSEAGLQWVQNAYLLMLAATVITCGRLGDILGRRRVFISGVIVFAPRSLRRALSTGGGVLVGGPPVPGL